jgi:hypothetical protein
MTTPTLSPSAPEFKDRRVGLIVFGIFVIILGCLCTFARVELIEMYRQMGFPPDQMAMMEKLSFVRDRSTVWWMLLGAVPFFAYLILVKKYFRRAA